VQHAAARLRAADSGLDGPDAQAAALIESAARKVRVAVEDKATLLSLEHYSRVIRPCKVRSAARHACVLARCRIARAAPNNARRKVELSS